MSEATESPSVEAQPLSQEAKVALVKNNMLQTHATLHNNIFNFVSGLPVNEDQKKWALANLIQSLHWVEDAIEALQFEVENMPPAPPVPEGTDVQPTEGEPQC